MRFSRRSRFVTALVALFSVLFMQLAAAAYACPTISVNPAGAAHAGWAIADSHQEMAGCEEVADMEQSALCFVYKQKSSQSLYKPPVPDIQPAVSMALVRVIGELEPAVRPVSTLAQAPWLLRVSDPPLSIRNCCFRI